MLTTIEGVGTPDNLHALQLAWTVHGGAQCGFCSPGFIVLAKVLLDENQSPVRQDVRGWFQKHRNLRPCVGYKPLVDAVRDAAKVVRGEVNMKNLAFKHRGQRQGRGRQGHGGPGGAAGLMSGRPPWPKTPSRSTWAPFKSTTGRRSPRGETPHPSCSRRPTWWRASSTASASPTPPWSPTSASPTSTRRGGLGTAHEALRPRNLKPEEIQLVMVDTADSVTPRPACRRSGRRWAGGC